MREITGSDIDDLRDTLPWDKGIAFKHCMDTLRALFKYCMDRGIITQLPYIPRVKKPKTTPKAITYKDQNKIISEVPKEHQKIIWAGCRLGLRPSELRALQVGDLDFKNKTITVQRAFEGDGIDKIKLRKTDDSLTIKLHEELEEMLRDLSFNKLPSVWVFTMPNGKPYRGNYLYHVA